MPRTSIDRRLAALEAITSGDKSLVIWRVLRGPGEVELPVICSTFDDVTLVRAIEESEDDFRQRVSLTAVGQAAGRPAVRVLADVRVPS